VLAVISAFGNGEADHNDLFGFNHIPDGKVEFEACRISRQTNPISFNDVRQAGRNAALTWRELPAIANCIGPRNSLWDMRFQHAETLLSRVLIWVKPPSEKTRRNL